MFVNWIFADRMGPFSECCMHVRMFHIKITLVIGLNVVINNVIICSDKKLFLDYSLYCFIEVCTQVCLFTSDACVILLPAQLRATTALPMSSTSLCLALLRSFPIVQLETIDTGTVDEKFS